MKTIDETKKYLLKNGKEGVSCPCCGQFVKLYKRKLNSGMAIFLVGLYRLDKRKTKSIFSNKEIYKEVNIAQGARDHAAMAHWKLIEEPNINIVSGKKKNGLWMITPLGRNFVNSYVNVPSHIFLYNKKCKGFSNTLTTITNALGKKFNYQELMNEK